MHKHATVLLVIMPTQDSNTEGKLSDISTAVSVPLQRDCSCSLSIQRHIFSCLGTADTQTVVFLAVLSYTALPAVDLSSLLASWVASTPPITVASTQLQVDTTCPVVIDSLQPQACSVATPAGPPSDLTLTIALACAGGIVLVSMVITIVAIVVALLVYRKRCIAQPKGRCMPSPHSSLTVMQLKEQLVLYGLLCIVLHCGGILTSVMCYCMLACCAGPTVPSLNQCMSMRLWTVRCRVRYW